MTKYDKPFLTYENQLNKLITDKGLNIDARDRSFGINALSTFSYYDICNGYKEVFMDNDTFKPGTSIYEILLFNILDVNFQSILFKYSVYVEQFFKTRFSYFLAEEYGVHQDDYLDYKIYSKRKLKNINKKLKYLKDYCNKPYDEPSAHYCQTKNHIPPWILFKNTNFSNTIDLATALKGPAKHKLCNTLIPVYVPESSRSDIFVNAITIVRKERNKIAHNLKFITSNVKNFNLDHNALTHFNGTLLHNNDSCGKNDIYSMIISLIILLSDSFLVGILINELVVLFESYVNDDVLNSILVRYLNITGIPQDILDRFDKYSQLL
ncbi:MAG: Abi family protein [Anaerovoracaceae bacterium]